MSIVFIPDTFEGVNKKTGQMQKWYVVCVALMKGNEVIKKSRPVLWLTEQEYIEYTTKK